MKHIILWSFALLSIQLSFAQLALKSAAPLPDHEMLGLKGDMQTLKSLNQKNGLVVIFSCNSCPFVVGSDDFAGWEKQYNNLHKMATNNNIGFVLINSNEGKRTQADSHEEMIKHASTENYSMPYLLDKNSVLAEAFGAKTTPHVYFFNQDMNLIYMGSIDNTWDNARKNTTPYLENAITQHSAGKKIQEPTSPPKGCGIKKLPK